MMNKRLFIGVPIQSEKAVQAELQWRNSQELNVNQINWTKPVNWHMTLFFLGDTPVSKIEVLKQLIEQSSHGISAFRSELSGVGLFPDSRHPKVMWIGLENVEPLLTSRNRLGNLLHDNEINFDNKPLKPHLTIARVKQVINQESILSWFQEYREMNFGPIKIDRIVLYESVLKPGGPEYRPVYQCILED
jgi:RNA 2',3'-cyclic 3'-phosphodiesterase